MAEGYITADYPGRPYYLRLYWRTEINDVANNRSGYAWQLDAISKSGYGSYAYDCGNWYLNIAGYAFSGCTALVFGPSGDYAGKTINLGSGYTGWVGHDANGYLNFQIGVNHQAPGPFGTADAGWRWVSGDRLAQVPPAPSPIGLDQVTTTSMRYRFTSNGDGGSPITSWAYQYSITPDFSSGNSAWIGSSGTSVVTGLDPGTKYYFRSRGQNAVGLSGNSAIISATTIPATPPGITVTPSVSGLGATITMTPPGGVTGVTEYNVQSRPVGGGTTVDRVSPGTVLVVASGLTPGNSYEWRANAEIGGYTSPWSDWVPATQPSPNTSAGDFFSGSTPDTADTDYNWLGTAENSVSTASLNVVTGWMSFNEGNDDSGGVGVVGQVNTALVAGYRGTRFAKVVFTADTEAEGFIAGVGWLGAAGVEVGSTYVGSIYTRVPGRSQRMQGGMAWYNVAEEVFDYSWGAEVVLTASASAFTRLVSGPVVAPAGAVRGAPVVRDISGTSWALWEGGDVFYMDAAMVTLNAEFTYFDGSYAGSIYDTAEYDYAWQGPANASVSVRYNIEVAYDPSTDPLNDPDCTPLPAPPLPPVIASDCIEEVGVWRRYIVNVPAGEVRLWSATLPTLVLTTGTVAERQVRIRYFPNPDGIAPEAVDTTSWIAEMILTYIPPETVITLDGVTQRVRAAVGGAAPIAANQLLYGTGGAPASWPELRCGIGYIVTLDVPTDAPAGNLETELLLTQRV